MTERRISNDWVVGYDNRYLQRERHSDYAPPQAKVSVCEWEDERIEIRYQGKARPNREIAAPEPQVPAAVNVLVKPRRASGWNPAAGHPWHGKTNELAANENRGDTSIEPNQGTFLKWVDRVSGHRLL